MNTHSNHISSDHKISQSYQYWGIFTKLISEHDTDSWSGEDFHELFWGYTVHEIFWEDILSEDSQKNIQKFQQRYDLMCKSFQKWAEKWVWKQCAQARIEKINSLMQLSETELRQSILQTLLDEQWYSQICNIYWELLEWQRELYPDYAEISTWWGNENPDGTIVDIYDSLSHNWNKILHLLRKLSELFSVWSIQNFRDFQCINKVILQLIQDLEQRFFYYEQELKKPLMSLHHIALLKNFYLDPQHPEVWKTSIVPKSVFINSHNSSFDITQAIGQRVHVLVQEGEWIWGHTDITSQKDTTVSFIWTISNEQVMIHIWNYGEKVRIILQDIHMHPQSCIKDCSNVQCHKVSWRWYIGNIKNLSFYDCWKWEFAIWNIQNLSINGNKPRISKPDLLRLPKVYVNGKKRWLLGRLMI